MNIVLVAKSQKDRQRIATGQALRGRSLTYAQSFTELIQGATLRRGEALLYICGSSSEQIPAEIEGELFRLKRFIQWGHPGAVVAASSSVAGQFATVLGIPLIDDAGNQGSSRALLAFVSSVPLMEPPPRNSSVGEPKPLSAREAAVLVGLRGGIPLKRIAHNLGISPNTVSTYKTRIMAKLGCTSIAELLQAHSYTIGDLREEEDR